MDIGTIIGYAVPIVFAIVGIALIILLIELVRTLKTTRNMLTEIKEQVDPTLANVDKITTDLVPVMQKVEPLVDRVQLTVDTVNLEMMRVDGILENVSGMTDTANSALGAVDTVANAPINLVNNVTSRVRGALRKDASDETLRLEEQRRAAANAIPGAAGGQPEDGVSDYDAATVAALEAELDALEDAAQPREYIEIPSVEVPETLSAEAVEAAIASGAAQAVEGAEEIEVELAQAVEEAAQAAEEAVAEVETAAEAVAEAAAEAVEEHVARKEGGFTLELPDLSDKLD